MSHWPDPVPGLVIRYSYLWRREADQGREEGVKDRPCAIVAAVRNDPGGQTVYVLPITRSTPIDHSEANRVAATDKIAPWPGWRTFMGDH